MTLEQYNSDQERREKTLVGNISRLKEILQKNYFKKKSNLINYILVKEEPKEVSLTEYTEYEARPRQFNTNQETYTSIQ